MNEAAHKLMLVRGSERRTGRERESIESSTQYTEKAELAQSRRC